MYPSHINLSIDQGTGINIDDQRKIKKNGTNTASRDVYGAEEGKAEKWQTLYDIQVNP